MNRLLFSWLVLLFTLALPGCSSLEQAITHRTIPATRNWFTWGCPEGYQMVRPATWHDVPECKK